MTISDVGVLSYLFSALAFLLLTLLLVLSWRGSPLGRMVILASGCTAGWALLMLLYQIEKFSISTQLVSFAEFVRNASWCVFLLRMSKQTGPISGEDNETPNYLLRKIFGALLLSTFIAIFILPFLAKWADIAPSVVADGARIAWVAVPIGGMLLVEQIYRSAGPRQKWILRYLCLGVGGIFAYDFFLYSDALLFKKVNQQLWQARGLVISLSAPLVAISIARNPAYDIAIHVSRNMVFHSITILGAGVYLLAMAGVGYAIRFYGGTWGGVLQVLFFCGAVLFLAAVIFSDKIRARTRLFLAKHFYSFKYDYRQEWLKFTENLAQTADSVPERVIRSIGSLVSSDAGLLWQKGMDGRYFLLARWEAGDPSGMQNGSLSSLSNFLEECRWVVDLDEYREYPEHYEKLDLPDWFLEIADAWLIVPLVCKQEVQAFIVLKHSPVRKDINWEDRDLLKMAGQQAAIHLLQYLADKALVEARQFEAFNRLSAYIVHDLKNILAQQALIVANAGKHRRNPEFVEDMIQTVENSVARMRRLMEQLRSGARGKDVEDINLRELLSAVVTKRSVIEPRPELVSENTRVVVNADRDQLANVFGHVIQNAQEATPKTGNIWVSLNEENGCSIIEVRDTGKGMSEDFVRNRLFQPFESTKGLTGMGIGLFESREYIRQIGGDISVDSAPGEGSTFRITLPLRVEVTENGESKIWEVNP